MVLINSFYFYQLSGAAGCVTALMALSVGVDPKRVTTWFVFFLVVVITLKEVEICRGQQSIRETQEKEVKCSRLAEAAEGAVNE